MRARGLKLIIAQGYATLWTSRLMRARGLKLQSFRLYLGGWDRRASCGRVD
ncbi:hypothetical protein OF001_U180115 [Pseudomonas sp. OF001]|nr:hypothetical protein OF001_U180115 [Pseudomonas sp. OF001]